jgi:large subunit ribosomal protein L5
MSQTQSTYKEKGIPSLMEKFAYPNVMAVPKIEKVVLNTGIGKTVGVKTGEDYRKFLEEVENHLSLVGGQKAATTKAKKSIAAFKLREGSVSGMKITLRGQKMYDFLDRFVHVVLPRSRDFRGMNPDSIDGQGNLTIGVKELIFFPEIAPENIRNQFGLEIVITTSAKTKEEGLELLKLVGFPFSK